MPSAGSLNKRVTFQVETLVPDGGGGNALAWTNVLTVWGSLWSEKGQERVTGGRLQAEQAGVLSVRCSSETKALTTTHRVLIGGAAHQIRAIANPDQRGRYLEMVVVAGVAQ